jgi:MoaA/NifB/PqqE/SkfB family radical SAM enzyme
MDARILTDYDATRDFSTKSFHSLCYAPYTSLYFDTKGDVRVCCHNWSHVVGSVATSSIGEIWKGAKLAQIRGAVSEYDFSQGCSYCEWQIGSRNFVNLAIAKWDKLPVGSSEPEWPLQMEFSISNTCNLECVMCNGMASSAIRAHREKLPPLANPYSDGFFDELRLFLPHLKAAKFLGGEPFLQEQCYRIWEMLIEDGVQLSCHVTTNGTIFNARVERVLDRLPVGISISLDGFTKETIEAVRVNARYEVLLANVARFQQYARARRTSFGLTFCLMRQNWRELGEFCLYADDLGCDVFVNSVRRPPELSVFTLPLADLKQIVDTMEEQAPVLLSRLQRNRQVWAGQLRLLSSRAAGAVEAPGVVAI